MTDKNVFEDMDDEDFESMANCPESESQGSCCLTLSISCVDLNQTVLHRMKITGSGLRLRSPCLPAGVWFRVRGLRQVLKTNNLTE